MRLVLLFVTILSVGMLGIVHFDFKRMIREKNELIHKNDSLRNENFINQTNATRYEIALDKLMEVDSVCGNKYNEMLSNIE